MKPINNWNNVQAISDKPQLPPGGYVCQIMGAEEKTYNGKNGPFNVLEVSVDICEGLYSNFFTDDYRNQQTENKKWGAVLKLYVPTDDGSDNDNFTKRKLKSFTDAVEDSNVNYHWDWDEKKLKGKAIGLLFRREEWEWEDKSGWKTRPFIPLPVDAIREEKFKVPADKPLQNKSVNYNSGTSSEQFSPIEDDDLPFV